MASYSFHAGGGGYYSVEVPTSCVLQVQPAGAQLRAACAEGMRKEANGCPQSGQPPPSTRICRDWPYSHGGRVCRRDMFLQEPRALSAQIKALKKKEQKILECEFRCYCHRYRWIYRFCGCKRYLQNRIARTMAARQEANRILQQVECVLHDIRRLHNYMSRIMGNVQVRGMGQMTRIVYSL